VTIQYTPEKCQRRLGTTVVAEGQNRAEEWKMAHGHAYQSTRTSQGTGVKYAYEFKKHEKQKLEAIRCLKTEGKRERYRCPRGPDLIMLHGKSTSPLTVGVGIQMADLEIGEKLRKLPEDSSMLNRMGNVATRANGG